MGFFDFVRKLFSGVGIIDQEEEEDERIYYRKIVKGGIYQDTGARGQKDKVNELQVWCYTFELDQEPDRAAWLIDKISPDSRYDDIFDQDVPDFESFGSIEIGSNWSNAWGYDDTLQVPFSQAQGNIYPNWQAGEE